MALDFMKNLFLSEEKKSKITHVMSLMAVILADGKVEDEEAGLLKAIAQREGLTDEEFNDILKGKKTGVKFTVPKDEEQKIQYLKDATAMMLIDGNLNPEELKLCIAIGVKLGLPSEKVSEIITGIITKLSTKGKNQDLPEQQQPDNASEKSEVPRSEDNKFPRPKFTKEETFALGSATLSFIIVNGKPDAKAEAVMIRELEGFTIADVRQLYQNFQKDQLRLLLELKKALAFDPLKKTYVAGFVAKTIKSRSDGGNNPNLVEAWKKMVVNIVGLMGIDNIDDAIGEYNRFEHGKLNSDDAFAIFTWLSQVQYAEHTEPMVRASQNEIESYDNKTVFTVDGKVSFTMIRVDGGSFIMGGNIDDEDSYDHERPRHEVNVSSFLIGETQVTQELWEAVMGNNPSNFKGKNEPVDTVSWHDCQSFVKKLNEKTGKKFRLPTEAEWEYAARGGRLSKNYTFSGSNDRNEVAWHPGNSEFEAPHEVKTKLPNELGIYDMSGNVLEWVNDWFSEYPSDKQTDPSGPSSGIYKVLRGGSWYNPSSFCRVSFRNYMQPDRKDFNYGFRLAL